MRNLELFGSIRELGREPTTDDFTTPLRIVNVVHAFGAIGLDPATNLTSYIVARQRVMLPDDGLSIVWRGHGTVWCNPPYSDPLPWVKKGLAEADEILYLLPTQTATEWGRRLLDGCNAICFVGFRIAFEIDGLPQPGAQFSCAIYYRGPRAARFTEVFAVLGKVVLL